MSRMCNFRPAQFPRRLHKRCIAKQPHLGLGNGESTGPARADADRSSSCHSRGGDPRWGKSGHAPAHYFLTDKGGRFSSDPVTEANANSGDPLYTPFAHLEGGGLRLIADGHSRTSGRIFRDPPKAGNDIDDRRGQEARDCGDSRGGTIAGQRSRSGETQSWRMAREAGVQRHDSRGEIRTSDQDA